MWSQTLRSGGFAPDGAMDKSPAFQRWDRRECLPLYCLCPEWEKEPLWGWGQGRISSGVPPDAGRFSEAPSGAIRQPRYPTALSSNADTASSQWLCPIPGGRGSVRASLDPTTSLRVGGSPRVWPNTVQIVLSRLRAAGWVPCRDEGVFLHLSPCGRGRTRSGRVRGAWVTTSRLPLPLTPPLRGDPLPQGERGNTRRCVPSRYD